MKLIVGLGNPEPRFDGTPHNVGFATMDKIAGFLRVEFKKKKNKGIMAEAWVGDERVILVKPLTYMNNSGECVYRYKKKFGVNLEDILIILDDIDLTPGLARFRTVGGTGTHNGLRDIAERLGTTNFSRIRIGVGSPKAGEDLADFVLRKIDSRNQKYIEVGIDKAVQLTADFVKGKLDSSTTA